MLPQPTGGVILVIDKTPNEPKTLLELKARKSAKATPAAPDPAAPRAPGAEAVAAATTGAGGAAAATAAGAGAAGAAEAAGVLTAIDEDLEGDENEAPCPESFDYETEGEGGG